MRSLVPFLLAFTVAACGRSNDGEESRPPIDQRARDSAIAESNLPGASGVEGAMSVADSAAARNARLDSIANER